MFYPYLKIFIIDIHIIFTKLGVLRRCFFGFLQEFTCLGLFDKFCFCFNIFNCPGTYLWGRLLFAIFPFQEFLSCYRINGVNQLIIKVHGKPFGFFLGFFEFRFKDFGRSTGNRFFTSGISFQGFFLHIGVNGYGCFAV